MRTIQSERKRKKTQMSIERIYDFMVDIALRHKRKSGESLAAIADQHKIYSSVGADLSKTGFVKKLYGLYTYTGMEPSLKIAEMVFHAYKAKTEIMKASYKAVKDVVPPLTLPEKVESIEVYEESLGKKIDRLEICFRHLYKELTGRELHL